MPKPQVAVVEADPFLDDFTQLDTRESEQPFADALTAIANEDPEAAGLPILEDEPIPASEPVVAIPPEPDKPEIIDAGEGATISFGKTADGWEAILDAGTGARPERYKGKTKDDVLRQSLIGKVHATRKINQLNRQVKLAQPQITSTSATVSPAFLVGAKPLTADEQFAFNTEFKVNAAAALEKWFGTRIEPELKQTAQTAKQSADTSIEILSGQEAREFKELHKDYLSTDDNYSSLLTYLVNSKTSDPLSRQLLASKNLGTLTSHLTRIGVFSAANLGEAYSELSEAGLLEVEQEEIPPTPVAVVATPPVQEIPPTLPVPTRPTRGQKLAGGYGLRTGTAIPPATPSTAPSVDELENLSDADVTELFNQTRQFAAKTRR